VSDEYVGRGRTEWAYQYEGTGSAVRCSLEWAARLVQAQGVTALQRVAIMKRSGEGAPFEPVDHDEVVRLADGAQPGGAHVRSTNLKFTGPIIGEAGK